MSKQYSVFLVPAGDDCSYTAGLIRELAAKYGVEPFEPHVTVYAGSFDGHEALETALREAVRHVGPFSLSARGLGFTEEYFKTLFIEFEESAVLRGIYERIRERLPHDSGYALMPHLSLLYHDMPLPEKETAVGMVRLDRRGFLFDEVKLVAAENREAGWRDTRRWKTRARVKLC